MADLPRTPGPTEPTTPNEPYVYWAPVSAPTSPPEKPPSFLRWWGLSTLVEVLIIAIPFVGWLPALILIPVLSFRGGRRLASARWPVAKCFTYVVLAAACFALWIASTQITWIDSEGAGMLLIVVLFPQYILSMGLAIFLTLIFGSAGVGAGERERKRRG